MKKIIYLIAFIFPAYAFAQNDLDALSKQQDSVKKKEYVSATFKGTRVVNFESVEVPGKHVLEFMIQHRFGDINGGINTFYGFDDGATIRFGLGYSYNGRLEIGIGRTSYQKMVDGYLKYRWLRQTTDNSMPVSVTLFGGAYCTTVQDLNAAQEGFNKYQHIGDRMSYVLEPIIAKKFSSVFSMQLNPTYIHYNLVDSSSDKNDAFVMGIAGRYKFNKRMAITFEYGLRFTAYTQQTYYNSMAIGWDIETGGHVFQMFVTNSIGIVDPQFMTQTNTSWQNGGIRIGFNISRAFNIN